MEDPSAGNHRHCFWISHQVAPPLLMDRETKNPIPKGGRATRNTCLRLPNMR